ncbi:MAG: PQQ-binding-like beta-propeller repeat protein [Acetobacter sp.]|nr:PQQ-binding-like beta-propeller repeat protein [Acetobacter sp.]
MHWFGKGLCLCGMFLSLVSCSQDKKLPEGIRISALGNLNSDNTLENKKISVLPAAYHNSSWAQAGVNPQHIIGNLKAGFTLQELWGENFGKGISKRDILLASPVVSRNRIFVMDSQGVVSSFDLNTGERLWENSLTANIGGFKETKSRASGLAVDGNTLFATTGFGGVFAMNVETGAPKWRKVMESPIRIAPAVTEKMLLIQTVDNKLYALDKVNGQELWRFGVAHEDTVIAGGATPAYDSEDNVVIAGFSNGEIVVLNAAVGTPLWSEMLVSNKQITSSTEINTIGAYPIVQDGVIYAISNSNIMLAIDMRSGDKLWEKEIGSMQNMLLAGDYLFVISNKNVLYAVDKNDGEVMWSIDVHEHLSDDGDSKASIYAAPPLMLNGQILLAFSNGRIIKVDAASGALRAKTDLGIDISNGLIAAQEKVIAVSDDADVIVFK